MIAAAKPRCSLGRCENRLDLSISGRVRSAPVVCRATCSVRRARAGSAHCVPVPRRTTYCRNGTANLLVLLDVHRPCRKVKVTERRPQKTMPNACATSSTSIIPTPSPSGRPGRSIDPLRRRPLSGVPARRSQADLAAVQVPLHPQAYRPAQRG